MRLPEIAIKNYRFSVTMMVLLVLVGLVSFLTMPRSEDPQFDVPGSTVVAVFPGANPEDLESLVVDPIEEAIKEVDDLKRIETTIEDGIAIVNVEMFSGVDVDAAHDNVVEAVNSVRGDLPPEVLSLEAVKQTITDVTVLQLALVSETASYHALREAAEELERRLERVAGVKKAETWAYPEQEVRVALDLEEMRQRGLTLAQVAGAVQAGSMNIPGGNVDLGARRFNVRTSGAYESLEDIRRVVVHAQPGRIVYLEDIADVGMDYEDETHRARYMGVRSVFVTLIQREQTHIFRVLEGARAQLAAFEAGLPEDIRLVTVFDQSESVDRRVNSFFSNLLQGILLVGLVMLVALGLRASVIVMLAIPVSILIAIAGVDLSGYGLQQMSIVGLVIALGLLVDNAIVVTENVEQFMKPGVSRLKAAIEGTKEVAWPIASATVTTVLAFVPMVLMQSGSGDYIRSMPVTVIFALAASLLVSLVLTPFLASRLLKPRDRSAARGWPWWDRPLQRAFGRLTDGPYRRGVGAVLRRPVLTLVLSFGLLAGSFALFPLIGVSFFPKAEKPQFLIDIQTPEGTSLDRTDAVVRSVEAVLEGRPEVVRYAANVGRDNPQVYYNIIPRREQSTVGQVVVEAESFTAAERLVPELRAVFASFPGVNIELVEFENGPPVEAPIAIKVIGPDLDVLRDLAVDVEALMRETAGTENIDNPLRTPRTDLRVRINREKAGGLGIPLVEIDRTVRAGIAGLPVAGYRDVAGEEHDIVLRLPHAGRPSMDAFDRIAVASATGAAVPLRQVATVELAAVPKRIDHFDLERVVTLTSDVAEGASDLDVTRAVIERLDAYDWPAGYRYFAGGTLEEQQEGFGSLFQALIVALLGIFGVLVMQFRSFGQPLIIFVSIPLAFIGSILALLATGYTFSFTAFVGLTSLVGIVINNAIILIDNANQRLAAGADVATAITEAGRTRFTPILLTTLTTIGGLLPMTLTGSSMWSPLGWVIIGGLGASTLLTLFVVPVLFILFTRAPESVVATGSGRV